MGRRFFTAAVIFFLTGLSTAGVLAEEVGNAVSPATGHAQVIAQGVAAFSAEDVVWKVDEESLNTQQDPVELAGPGFAIGSEGSILVHTAADLETQLSPGEATFLSPDITSTAINLSSDPSVFTSITLSSNAPVDANDQPIFRSESFTAASGRRDLALIKDVLKSKEHTQIHNGDSPALIFVQTGAITVKNANGGTIELAGNEANTLTGPLTVTATGSRGAVFYVVVIGPEIVTTTGSITPTGNDNATETPDVAGTGVITIDTYLCSAGISVAAAAPATCGDNSGLGSGELLLTGGLLNGPTDALVDHGRWFWDTLVAGDYTVSVGQYPDGYPDYAIDLNPSVRHVGADLLVSLAEPDATVSINVYFLAEDDSAPTGSAALGLTFYDCPAGTTPDDLDGSTDPGCTRIEEGLGVTLSGDQLAQPLTADSLQVVVPQPSLAGDWQWSDLLAGSYSLSVDPLQAGDLFYFTRPCGDQSCPPVSGFGTSVAFELTDEGLTLLIYRIPAS